MSRCETLIPYGTRTLYGAMTVLKTVECPRTAVEGTKHCTDHQPEES